LPQAASHKTQTMDAAIAEYCLIFIGIISFLSET
jgi:hypothetical protein